MKKRNELIAMQEMYKGLVERLGIVLGEKFREEFRSRGVELPEEDSVQLPAPPDKHTRKVRLN